MKKPGSEGRVDLVQEFEKQQTDPISIGQESITAGVGKPNGAETSASISLPTA
jgi:hypothetical protein